MKRIVILVYGLIAYLAFFATILYAMGFLGSMFVPKGINDGTSVSLIETIGVNVGILLLFAVQHTIMARPKFKAWWTRVIPESAERSTFVLISSLILGLLFWQWRPLPDVVWDIENQMFRNVMLTLSCIGWVILFYSSFLINHFDLFGLKQVYFQFIGKPYTHDPFVLKSMYKYVRHPLMFGFIMAFWFTPTMTQGHLLFAAVSTGYIVFGVTMEERDLVGFHGERYQQYQKSTPMLIPWKWGKGKKD